jgi:ABC-type lipoprotein export system ATPase subunit
MMNPRGSEWSRWDPHIHGPGTLSNDQFSGKDPWEEYLNALETSNPPIRALGITDYFCLDVYEEVLKRKAAGRLSNVELIFPNVEMRFGIGTGSNSPINFHLLFSPEDPNHVEEIKRFMKALTFGAHGDTFRVENADLQRLGKRHDKRITDDAAALRSGANQFKVSFPQLKDAIKNNAWVQENLLIAVASGTGDGTAGLQKDASLATLRQEIERFSHIVFDSNQKCRDFWLGKGVLSPEKIIETYDDLKPCFHGSDAHSVVAITGADTGRLCWLKGDLSFETLIQACLEPETRVAIGPSAPLGALPSQTIDTVEITNASWLQTPKIPLNSGLVAVIGSRGSGKTALADIIAAGASSLSENVSDRSFISRASQYLSDSSVELLWKDGDKSTQDLGDVEADSWVTPRVRYLSQQFVDTLCLSEGITDELLQEIERVIYQAHPPEEKLGTSEFQELLDLKAQRGRQKRIRNEEALLEIGRELNVERERRESLPRLQKERDEKAKAIDKDKEDRKKLTTKGSEKRLERLEEISAVAETLRTKVEQFRRRQRSLMSLQGTVEDVRTTQAPTRLRQMKEQYGETGIRDDGWKEFLLRFGSGVDGVVDSYGKQLEEKIRSLTGPTETVSKSKTTAASTTTLLPEGTPLKNLPLNLLDKEISRLRLLVGVDAESSKKYSRISEKISRDEAALASVDRSIASAKKAEGKIKELIESRRTLYGSVFGGIVDEQTELGGLYEPLKRKLAGETGALGRLTFSVQRIVNTEGWAEKGETLLDLRTNGPFKGKGTLLDAARKELLSAWQIGSAVEVSDAMARFREAHEAGLAAHSPVGKTDRQAYRAWGEQISAWLYGTDHIHVVYGISYDGVDIQQLSPGTRGIVLLLLYLAIDTDDDRPLIIDQPEENLDPKSINDELVQRFRKTKMRRQIIIVSHNANLVVNADADQVIVARCGQHKQGELPKISYESGSLENPVIRRHVIDILEGGEPAFRERARRLRIRLRN